MFSSDEHEKSFITSRADLTKKKLANVYSNHQQYLYFAYNVNDVIK